MARRTTARRALPDGDATIEAAAVDRETALLHPIYLDLARIARRALAREAAEQPARDADAARDAADA